jgi:hypothetical protein
MSPKEAKEEPMQQLGSQRQTARSRPRLAGAWLDCSAVAYYPGVALGIAAAGVLLYLLLGVAP